MFALFDREFRRARGAARNLINLYDRLKQDSAFDARIRKVVAMYDSKGKSRPFDSDFYFFFLHDIGQCHRILDVPVEPGRASSMAALIFIAHVFNYDATAYGNFQKLKANPEVMKPFFSLFSNARSLANENPDKMALLSGLNGYKRDLLLNCALVLDIYGNYLKDMEGVSIKDYRRFDEILKKHTDIISTSRISEAIEEEVARGISRHPPVEEKATDSPAARYKTRRAPEGYYGMNGEFETNDRSRQVSEDIEQFSNAHPDADVTEHYYWDEVLDAETDDYIKANNE